jgi:hypothetical protein
MPPFGKKSYFGFIGLKDADHAPLMDAIDAAMLKIKADGRMATLQKKWFGASFDTPDSVKEPGILISHRKSAMPAGMPGHGRGMRPDLPHRQASEI